MSFNCGNRKVSKTSIRIKQWEQNITTEVCTWTPAWQKRHWCKQVIHLLTQFTTCRFLHYTEGYGTEFSRELQQYCFSNIQNWTMFLGSNDKLKFLNYKWIFKFQTHSCMKRVCIFLSILRFNSSEILCITVIYCQTKWWKECMICKTFDTSFF